MRIGMDARFLGPESKGLGRHNYKLLKGLEQIDGENEYYIFLRKYNYDKYQPSRSNFHRILADIPWYGVEEQIRFPRILHSYNLDLMHFLHFNVPLLYRRPFVVTIHDLILLDYPTQKASTRSRLTYGIKYAAYKNVLAHAVYKSKHIIATSEYTKQAIADRFSVSTNAIQRIYAGLDISSFHHSTEEQNPEKKDIFSSITPYRYFLYVGNAYPHKNLETLVDVFARFLSYPEYADWKLVLVGKEDYFYRTIKQQVAQRGIENNVIFTGFVSDKDLGKLYAEAGLFIFPSLYEGFGFPPLEALSAGAPVLSSDRTSLPEVCGDTVEYINPTDQAAFLQKLRECVDNLDWIREEQQRKAPALLNSYSWEEMAKQVLAVYNEESNS